MTRQTTSYPIALKTKKFYCCKCGERMLTKTKTRLIRRGDPDYKEHSRFMHTHMFGDVELTEYDFKCYSCDNVVDFDTQCVIDRIQKELHKTVLSDAEIAENQEKAKTKIKKQAKVKQIIITLFAVIIIALILYFKIKSGDFSFKVYF